ncbi:acyl-CoA thioesterase [Phaeodactylibacter sp.]|jgi:acyl-CoA thioester hydrolase|uniref:acyl-CoA thioesterase n=1 Tax=Phaeodactylibacter sp. TaxID=1940289 RepID=UPI0025D0B8ED|nr:acyl-CoA thioesterase [Phaeodactylibacter sp.]MCI4651085.1 acyl-CoA thioesterase [Phaeodactylibacter sp.]MCI5092113.1 acyl-CoA thioesterase [Phaeodactylibacter sp.]
MASAISELADFPVQTNITVQWGEMDAANHVNNVVYLRWFEHARVVYLDRLNYPVVLEQEGLPGVILAKQDCKYLFPVRYPDTITMGIKVTEMSEDRFVMHCKMYSQKYQRLVAIANATIVTYDYVKQSKAPVPESLRRGIQAIEQQV